MIDIAAFVAVGEPPGCDAPAGAVVVGCGFAVGTGVGVGVGEGDADPQALTVKQAPSTNTAIQLRTITNLQTDPRSRCVFAAGLSAGNRLCNKSSKAISPRIIGIETSYSVYRLGHPLLGVLPAARWCINSNLHRVDEKAEY